jgi:hypothetical protein
MKHTNTFRVECCANRRAVVNDVLVCVQCDMPGAIPNWKKATMPANNVQMWTPKRVNPT